MKRVKKEITLIIRMIRIMMILSITRIIHMKKMIERTRTRTITITIINKMINFSHKTDFVSLSSLTHIAHSFNVSSSIN